MSTFCELPNRLTLPLRDLQGELSHWGYLLTAGPSVRRLAQSGPVFSSGLDCILSLTFITGCSN